MIQSIHRFRSTRLLGPCLFLWATDAAAQPQSGDTSGRVELRPLRPTPAASLRPLNLSPLAPNAVRPTAQPELKPLHVTHPATSPNLVSVPLSLGGKPMADMQITGGRLREQGNGAGHVAEMAAGGQLVVAPKVDTNPSVVLRPLTRTRLSGLVIRPQAGTDALSVSRVFSQMDGQPVWMKERGSYKVSLLLGLEPDDKDTHVPGPLPRPIQLHLRADAGSFEPANVSINSEGVDGYRTIAFFCSTDANKDRVQVRFDIMGDMGKNPQTIEVKRTLDKLVIEPTYQTIAGLGFGTTSLRIERLAEDGDLLPDLAPLTVPIFASAGFLSRPEVAIPSGLSFAQIEFRSAGVGEARLDAGSGDWKASSIAVSMKTPLGAIIAILLGGLTGGVLHMLRKRSSRKAWIVEGVLVGAVTLAILYFKPDLMTLVSSAAGTELGAFGLSALAGLLGTPVLDKLAATVFPGLVAAEKAAKGRSR